MRRRAFLAVKARERDRARAIAWVRRIDEAIEQETADGNVDVVLSDLTLILVLIIGLSVLVAVGAALLTR